MIRHFFACLGLFSVSWAGDWVEKTLSYENGTDRFAGTVVFQEGSRALPAIVMVPNWMGPTEQSLEKARKVAQSGPYVVFVVDMYGIGVRPKTMEEASAAAALVRGNRSLQRARINKAVEAFVEEQARYPWDGENIAAIGFCFGGGTVLELARSGNTVVDGVVSFHGNLDTPRLTDAHNIEVPVLVLHGAKDPFVSPADVTTFRREMTEAGVDATVVEFAEAVHSFTDPYAAMQGKAEYHQKSSDRAFAVMDLYLREWFVGEPVRPVAGKVLAPESRTEGKGLGIWVQPGKSPRPGSVGKKH